MIQDSIFDEMIYKNRYWVFIMGADGQKTYSYW